MPRFEGAIGIELVLVYDQVIGFSHVFFRALNSSRVPSCVPRHIVSKPLTGRQTLLAAFYCVF